MAQLRFEKNILLPLLANIESSSSLPLYDCYLTKIYSKLSLIDAREVEKGEGVFFAMIFNDTAEAFFLYNCSNIYMSQDQREMDEAIQSNNKMVKYMESKGYQVSDQVGIDSLFLDEKMYELFKVTRSGSRIKLLSGLREYLSKKMEQAEDDIISLLEK